MYITLQDYFLFPSSITVYISYAPDTHVIRGDGILHLIGDWGLRSRPFRTLVTLVSGHDFPSVFHAILVCLHACLSLYFLCVFVLFTNFVLLIINTCSSASVLRGFRPISYWTDIEIKAGSAGRLYVLFPTEIKAGSAGRLYTLLPFEIKAGSAGHLYVLFPTEILVTHQSQPLTWPYSPETR